jgi:hypothetical protein
VALVSSDSVLHCRTVSERYVVGFGMGRSQVSLNPMTYIVRLRRVVILDGLLLFQFLTFTFTLLLLLDEKMSHQLRCRSSDYFTELAIAIAKKHR